MKLGTETGSLINHLMAGENAPMPVVGGPATVLSWSDRKPGTVIGWDDYTRTDSNGMSEDQDYEYTRNPNNPICCFRRDANGWVAIYRNELTGRWKKTSGSVYFGKRERYYDFSF